MPSQSLYGDYEVIAPLARGGMGGVYLASHVRSGERVALKVLDPAFASHDEVVSRLYSEHTLARRATHPGLVEIHAAASTNDGLPYLVMEYLAGRTLASIHGDGLLDVTTIIGIGAQLAGALAALHDAGIIHCDIKPENVFVLERSGSAGPRSAAEGRRGESIDEIAWGSVPQVKVIDFGVSRTLDEPPPDDASIAGTPAYMAPEQWRGRPQTASDVYAFGCVLYELITGEVPFEGSLPEVMVAHLERRPARPSWLRRGLPIELERLVLRALAKDPAHRPTMHELAGDLTDLADAERCVETQPMAIAV